MALNYADLSNTFSTVVSTAQSSLEAELADYNPETATSADLIDLQFSMQKWNMAADMASNTLKAVGEGMRNSVANIK